MSLSHYWYIIYVVGYVINFKLKPELILKHFPASDNIKDLFKIMNNFIDVQNFHRKVWIVYEEQNDAPPFAAIVLSIQVLCLATSAYTPYNPSWEGEWEISWTVKNHSQQHIRRSSWKPRPSRVFWWGRSSQWGVLRYPRDRCSCLKLVTRLDEFNHS